ncbi:MAG: hypothetical protein IJ849_08825 [Selenomonadaceae bacterium]|nr:hypothetical protein [Selenomonadaceae bacterium]
MAKQYKKLQQKIHPPKKTEPPKAKPGKDYLLMAVIVFTLGVLILGWNYLDNMNRAMYFLLVASLTLTYANRHARLTATQKIYMERASMASMGLAVAMFVILLVQQYILS